MPEIRLGNSVVTHITTIDVDPIHQRDLLDLMRERARFMAKQPGFVSISLHRGIDGNHVVNYVQWADRAQLDAALRAPEFRAMNQRFGALIQDVGSSLYDVVLVEEK
jgi:quinol monooxygenase YgiN